MSNNRINSPENMPDTTLIGTAFALGTLLLGGGTAADMYMDEVEAEQTAQVETVSVTDTATASAPEPGPVTYRSGIDDALADELDTNVDRLLGDTYREAVRQTFSEVSQYRDLIEEASDETGLDEDFIRSYLAVESAGGPRAYSHAHAAGIAQFIESTARGRGMELNDFVDERYDPEVAIKESAEYYQDLIERFGSKKLALIAYNCGEQTTSNLIAAYGTDWSDLEPHLYNETENYVVKILSREQLLEQGFDYEEKPLFSERQERADIHRIEEGETMYSIGQDYGVDIGRIKGLNPRIRDFNHLKPGYALYIPHPQPEQYLVDRD